MNTLLKTPRYRVALSTALLCALAPLGIASTALAQAPHEGHSFSGGHMSAPSGGSGGHANYAHDAAPAHFAAHENFAPHQNFAPGNYSGRAVRVGSYADNRIVNHAAVASHFAPGAGSARLAPGRYVPGRGFNYGHWTGGYWHGGFWPRVYWGSSFAWFLPVLPVYAATYWWNSVPYYYYNDVYYTYDPSASGYVVTTPPPAQESSSQDGVAANASDPIPAGSNYSSPAPSGGPSNSSTLYAYPKNGQSDEQQSTDRQECSQWALGQTGSDGNGTSMDYQRAMTACLQGRGYSVN